MLPADITACFHSFIVLDIRLHNLEESLYHFAQSDNIQYIHTRTTISTILSYDIVYSVFFFHVFSYFSFYFYYSHVLGCLY